MTDRRSRRTAFLAAHGWAGAAMRPIAADASFRRYDRLTAAGGGSVILMDAPPPQEDVRPFVAVARALADLGLSAPAVLAADIDDGFLLLEDFGDDSYARRLAAGANEDALYTLALDALISLHRRYGQHPAPAVTAAYDDDRLLAEALLLVDWYLPAVRTAPLSAPARSAYAEHWRAAFTLSRHVPQSLVLRDYHVDNLMLLPGREAEKACGLLDFQDAVHGPVTYDIVSLFEDARRDVPAALTRRQLGRYLQAFPAIDKGDFMRSYAILGAQRSAKILGIFTRLDRRDGKPGYLRHIARVWRWLEGDLAHPSLAALREWFACELPVPLRTVPTASGGDGGR